MPSEVATPPAPPAAGTPPPQPPVTPQPTDQQGVSKRIFDLLMTPTDEASLQHPPEERKEAPKPEAKPTEPEKPIRVAKKKEAAPPPETPPEVPTREELRRKAAAPPPPVVSPTPAAPAKAEDDTAFEGELVDEEKALLQDARDAERHLPAKYKGQGTKLVAFLRENVKRTSDPNFDPEDPEYAKWYTANLPKINPLDLRQVERARVTEDVERKFEPRIEQERQARWAETEAPRVTAKAQAARQKLVATALPEEVLTAFNERVKNVTEPAERLKIAKEVESEFALEFETAEKIIGPATEQIEEFHRLTTVNPATGKALAAVHKDAEIWDGAKWAPNVNATDPVARKHAYILAMVAELARDFKENGGTARQKDGKWFVTRAEWADMEQAVKENLLTRSELAKWWTFTNEEIIERAVGRVKGVIADAVKTNRAQLERLGYRRQPAVAGAPPAPPQRGSPPAPRPTPPPGPGSGPAMTAAQTMAARLNAPTTLT